MLVDRVLVEKISNDAATDFFEIRKDLPEQTDFMHREKRVVDAFPVLHHLENGSPGARIVAENAVSRLSPAAEWLRVCRESSRAFFRWASAKAAIISNGSAKSDVIVMRFGVPTIASSQKTRTRAQFRRLSESNRASDSQRRHRVPSLCNRAFRAICS